MVNASLEQLGFFFFFLRWSEEKPGRSETHIVRFIICENNILQRPDHEEKLKSYEHLRIHTAEK